jgi:hypothetical protein
MFPYRHKAEMKDLQDGHYQLNETFKEMQESVRGQPVE